MYNKNNYDDALLWCTKRLEKSVRKYLERNETAKYLSDAYQTKGQIQVELGLLLLVFNVRLKRTKSFDLGEKHRLEIISHLQKILKLGIPDPHEYYLHPYSVPDKIKEAHDLNNKYLYFVIRPITVLALMENGKVKENLDYITNTIKYYRDEIMDKGFHVNSTGRIATGDNMWIAKCLNKFSNLDDVEIKYQV